MTHSAALEIRDLAKSFVGHGNSPAGGIQDISLSLSPGTFFTLLGPSGCGKTTTLRCIAGLERPDKGVIRVAGQTLLDTHAGIDVALERRGLGMVFQSYAIWPHMTVFENVAFPLRVAKDRRYEKAEINKMVGEALERVNLSGFQTRPATRLSGGQQQRVALARAIVRQPKLLLLDEPLSNLDATLREEMRNELKRLQRQVGVTTVYVTHDQAEALDMSDLIAVIDQGRVVQMGSPREIYFRPRNAFVAGFVGATNILHGVSQSNVARDGYGAVALKSGHTATSLFPDPAAASEEMALLVRPEAILLSAANSPARDRHNRLPGVVRFTGFLGNMCRYTVQVGEATMHVNTDPDVNFAIGSEVALEFPYERTISVPAAVAPAVAAAA